MELIIDSGIEINKEELLTCTGEKETKTVTSKPELLTTAAVKPPLKDDALLLKCEKCDFSFKSPYFMHQHFEQVHGIFTQIESTEDLFLCQICSAPFTTPEGLSHHTKYVHEKVVKPFLCDKCDKSFR
jgi:hypothetical protein